MGFYIFDLEIFRNGAPTRQKWDALVNGWNIHCPVRIDMQGKIYLITNVTIVCNETYDWAEEKHQYALQHPLADPLEVDINDDAMFLEFTVKPETEEEDEEDDEDSEFQMRTLLPFAPHWRGLPSEEVAYDFGMPRFTIRQFLSQLSPRKPANKRGRGRYDDESEQEEEEQKKRQRSAKIAA